DPRQHIAAKCLRHPETFAYPRRQTELRPNRTAGQSIQDPLDQPEALLDLADTDPDAGVDVAALEDGNVEGELIVRPIPWDLARVEGAGAGTPDGAARAKLPCHVRAQDPSRGGAVLQRGRVVVELDQFRERLPDVLQQGGDVPYPPGRAVTPRDARQHG